MPADLSARLKDLDAYIEKVRQDWEVPGVAIAIVRGDELVHAKGFGLRDLEKELPVTGHALFAIGSTTK